MSERRPIQVIPLVYDLIVWSSAKIGEFTRKHRCMVGDRPMTWQLDVLDRLIVAQYTPRARRAAAAALEWGPVRRC